MTIGRSSSCDIVIPLSIVSRLHARIELQHDRYVLSDAGSANGTFVNGRRIDGPTKIDHGTLIGLGPITLSFIVMAAPASTQPIGSRHAAE